MISISRPRLSLFALFVMLLGTGCTQAVFFAANAPAAFSDVARLRDIQYGALPRNRLDVYQRRTTGGGKPVVVFFHGGGWNSGDKDLYRFVGVALAQQGYVAVVPDYRLYPQGKFAEQMQDAAAAVVWARTHAAEWGGDPEQLFVMGHSAGAHLAMMLALNAQYLQAAGGTTAWLRGVMGLAGPYNFIPFTFDYMFDLFGPPENYPASQPINFVSANAPPVLLMHGRRDRTVDPRNTITLNQALISSDAQVRTVYFEKADHSDLIASFSVLARDRVPVMAELRRFIAEHAHAGMASPSR